MQNMQQLAKYAKMYEIIKITSKRVKYVISTTSLNMQKYAKYAKHI